MSRKHILQDKPSLFKQLPFNKHPTHQLIAVKQCTVYGAHSEFSANKLTILTF